MAGVERWTTAAYAAAWHCFGPQWSDVLVVNTVPCGRVGPVNQYSAGWDLSVKTVAGWDLSISLRTDGEKEWKSTVGTPQTVVQLFPFLFQVLWPLVDPSYACRRLGRVLHWRVWQDGSTGPGGHSRGHGTADNLHRQGGSTGALPWQWYLYLCTNYINVASTLPHH